MWPQGIKVTRKVGITSQFGLEIDQGDIANESINFRIRIIRGRGRLLFGCNIRRPMGVQQVMDIWQIVVVVIGGWETILASRLAITKVCKRQIKLGRRRLGPAP